MSLTYYFLPTRNVFGEGAVNEAGKLMKSLDGTHPMIVTDAFLAKSGMADQVKKILEDEGLPTYIFGGAEPNPTDKNVVAGVAAFKEQGCDSIISLGGGSSHDCAKAIGLIAANGGEIYDYEGIDISKNKMVPLMAINTTAGTASEITRFCIITDTRRKVKMAILDWRVTPQIAINDPVLMKGMPPRLTAATGMDALTHAIEAYVSSAANPLTDAAALQAINMIQKYLPKAVANGDYLYARDKMACTLSTPPASRERCSGMKLSRLSGSQWYAQSQWNGLLIRRFSTMTRSSGSEDRRQSGRASRDSSGSLSTW